MTLTCDTGTKAVQLIFLGILFTLLGEKTIAQCHCSISSSSLSLSENGTSVILARKQWMADVQVDARSFKRMASDHLHDHTHHHDSIADENMNELKSAWNTVAGIRYGLTERITLIFQQPYLRFHTPAVNRHGMGDLALLAGMRLLDNATSVLVLFVGSEFPTGKKAVLAGENNLVMGSGSFDPGVGMLFSRAWGKTVLLASTNFKYGTEGYHQTNYGNFFSHNLMFSYTPGKNKALCASDSTGGNKKISCTLSALVLGEWTGVQFKDGNTVQHTGGYRLLGGISTQLSFYRWQIPFTCSIPVYERLIGQQNELSLRLRTGIVKSF